MFYNPRLFPFLESMQASWRGIRSEYDALTHGIKPKCLIAANGGCKFIAIRMYEKWYVDFSKAPILKHLTDTMPGFQTCQFAVMEPGATIDWHSDPCPKTVRSHIGLKCKPGSFLQVDNDVLPFLDGEFILFDETVRHKSWNEGKHQRVSLVFGFDMDPSDPELNVKEYYISIADGYTDAY
jgi:aspartyl/asparaginyl beta-hydroxylase (cupin superfamily)